MSTNISHSAYPLTSRRGQKTCPKCLTMQSNRAAFCKRKGCDHSFKINVKRKHTTSVCKLQISHPTCNVYSVRLVVQGPDYRGFVEHQLYSNTGDESSQNRKSIVKCLVDSCVKKSQSEPPLCPHIESTFNCFTEAEVLPINLEMIVNLQIPQTAKAAIEKRMSGTKNCLVQRVSTQVMVVDNGLRPSDSIDLKHCSFYTENVPPHKFGSKHRFSCSCKSHIKKKSISNKNGRPLKEVKKYGDSKITPVKCWHYYACIAAFASQQHLMKEFDSYIKQCEFNILQSINQFSPEHIKVDVDLGADTMIMDCDSDIFNMTDLNLDPCLNKSCEMSNFPLSTIPLHEIGNGHTFCLENEVNSKTMTYKITDTDMAENLPIEICSTEETLNSNKNVGNDIFSPVEIVDVFTSNIDNFLSTCGDNMNDQSSIEIITLNKIENMVENSIEFDINNEVTVGNEIDQAILLNDDNMFIQLNDRDTLVFPEDVDILSDGTFDLHCTDDNTSKPTICHNNAHNKKRILKKTISNSNTKPKNIDISTDVESFKNADSIKQKSLTNDIRLDFLEWLASVTEIINETMHFQLLSGKPDPLVFHVNQIFFQSLCARMSPDPSKRRMPDLTSRYEPNKPPFGSYTMFTWRLTNIFQIKKIFETPKVPLKLTRLFIRNHNGNYTATIEQNVKTPTKMSESKKPHEKMNKDLVMTYLKIDKSLPFRIEWIPDMFPATRTGELRIIFEFGHRRIIRV